MRDRQAHDTANTISNSPANDAANTNTGCSTTAPYYGVGDSHILSLWAGDSTSLVV